ncbi:MAG: V-type ATP synthase subunit E [Candidatus Helarchaeota archaeon]
MDPDEIPLTQRIDILMKEVIEDAELKAEMAIRQAEKKSKEKIKNATKQFEKEIGQMFEDFNDRFSRESEIKLADAHKQLNNEILLAKEKIVESVLERLKEKLINFSNTPQYKSYLINAFKDLLNILPPDHYIIYFNKEDHDKISKLEIETLAQNHELKFSIAQDEFIEAHGIVLQSKDQRLRLEDTLEMRFTRKTKILRSKIANVLFKDVEKIKRG